MSAPTALQRIVADNDPRNGSIIARLVRMCEHPERQPDADGLYHDDGAQQPRDLKCECGYEWTEYLRTGKPNPPCPTCSSEVVVS